MKQYLEALYYVKEHGEVREDRTGIGTIGVFGYQCRFDLREGFPAPTTKRLAWRAVVSELLWFLEGSGDERRLCEILHGTRDPGKKTIWTANAENQGKALGYSYGLLGPIYGCQWRTWGGGDFDQITNLVRDLKDNPFSRRHILSAWNADEIKDMALPPCHILAQFYVNNKMELSCQMYQRSCDMLLGAPFNIASYSLLTHMLAQVCGLKVGEFVWTIGDAHIYSNHLSQVEQQLDRYVKTPPTLKLDTSITEINDFTMESFELLNYKPQSSIPAPMAV